jgi:hypothetical protein
MKSIADASQQASPEAEPFPYRSMKPNLTSFGSQHRDVSDRKTGTFLKFDVVIQKTSHFFSPRQ